MTTPATNLDPAAAALDHVHDAVAALAARKAPRLASRKTLAALAASAPSNTTSRPAAKAPVAATAAPTPTTQAKERAEYSIAPRTSLVAELTRKPAAKSTPAPTPIVLGDFPRIAPTTGSKVERLDAMRSIVLACEKCPNLVSSRTHVVFGIGDPDAEIMFVGEAPGADEDQRGEPFVGAAGQLLTKIITAMNLTREKVFIANILKCRPDMKPGLSGNRPPEAKEMEVCLPYLREQIEIVAPRVLVALGATAMKGLLGETSTMSSLRGRWHDFAGTPLMATYHPAYLLRNQSISEKRKVWEDMLMVLEYLDHPISDKQRGFFLSKA